MPKKYLKANNTELLEEFGIPCAYMTVNYRCHRLICKNTVKDVDKDRGNPHCTCENNKEKRSFYVETGNSSLKKDTKNIYHELTDTGETRFYYNELMVDINPDDGSINFFIRKNTIVIISDSSMSFESYKLNLIQISDLKNAIDVSGIKNPDFNQLLDIALALDYVSADYLATVQRCLDGGFELLKDTDFLKKYSLVASDIINRSYSYSGFNYKTIYDIAKKCNVPNCLAQYLDNIHYKKFAYGSDYKDITNLDRFPEVIKDMFSVYVCCGKMNKSMIYDFLRSFNPDNFTTPESRNCFVNFVKKNLYKGDNLFSAAKRVLDFLVDEKIPITEDTFNWKYYCVSIGARNYYGNTTVNRHMVDDYMYTREEKGVVFAMKRLLENLNISVEAESST